MPHHFLFISSPNWSLDTSFPCLQKYLQMVPRLLKLLWFFGLGFVCLFGFFFLFEVRYASFSQGWINFHFFESVISCSGLFRFLLWLLTTSVYRPVAFLELLFLLEEIEVAKEEPCACAMCVQQDLFQPSGGFLPPDIYNFFFLSWSISSNGCEVIPELCLFPFFGFAVCVSGAISPGSVAHQQLRRAFAALFTNGAPGAVQWEQMGQGSTLLSVGLEDELIIQPVACHTSLIYQRLVWKTNPGEQSLAGSERGRTNRGSAARWAAPWGWGIGRELERQRGTNRHQTAS